MLYADQDGRLRATHVPVGQDQHQHLEFARECATNFNHAYGQVFPHPQTMSCMALLPCPHEPFHLPPQLTTYQASTHRIMSLNDPSSKMSKSNKSERSRILITDTPEQIKAKIASALTDSLPGISYDTKERPGISNLLDILSIFDPETRDPKRLATHFSEISPRQLKDIVAESVISGLKGVRERFMALLDDKGNQLDKIAEFGSRRARESAEETMCLVRESVGL
jgi:tryptophanyl-tRNA synthetase